MSTLFHLCVALALSSAILIMVEKYAPNDPEANNFREDQLPKHLTVWRKSGKIVEIMDSKIFVVDRGTGPDTIALIHGFPSSSYDYNKAIDLLTKDFRVVAFDHLGFGFSDKPNDTYTYSMVDQAEVAVALWKSLGVKSAHVVAHDMGDSVLTEILARRDRNALPDHFNKFFKSVTFTNGGMKYGLSRRRLSQTLLTVPKLGEFLSSLSSKLRLPWKEATMHQQLKGVWSPEYASAKADEMDADIQDMILLNRLNDGWNLFHKTISYLSDRKRFEDRWLDSLSRLDVPCMLFWGDADDVAPMDIPKALAAKTIPKAVFTGKTLKNAGHFLMLEQPEAWAKTIKEFVTRVK